MTNMRSPEDVQDLRDRIRERRGRSRSRSYSPPPPPSHPSRLKSQSKKKTKETMTKYRRKSPTKKRSRSRSSRPRHRSSGGVMEEESHKARRKKRRSTRSSSSSSSTDTLELLAQKSRLRRQIQELEQEEAMNMRRKHKSGSGASKSSRTSRDSEDSDAIESLLRKVRKSNKSKTKKRHRSERSDRSGRYSTPSPTLTSGSPPSSSCAYIYPTTFFKPLWLPGQALPGYIKCKVCTSYYGEEEEEQRIHLSQHPDRVFCVSLPGDSYYLEIEEAIMHLITKLGIGRADLEEKNKKNNLIKNPSSLIGYSCSKCETLDTNNEEVFMEHMKECGIKAKDERLKHLVLFCRGCQV